MLGFYKVMCWVMLVSLQLSFAASIPTNAPHYESIGISKLGLFTEQEAKAFNIVQKQMSRWIENHPEWNLMPILSPQTFSLDDLETEKTISKMNQLLTKFKNSIIDSNTIDKSLSVLEEIKTLRKRMTNPIHYGVVLRKTYLYEAAYFWKAEEIETSLNIMSKAVAINPLADFDISDWDSFSPYFNVELFSSQIVKKKNKVQRGCWLEWGELPKSTKIIINGFEIPKLKEVAVTTQSPYYLVFDSPQHEKIEVLARCDRPQKKKLSLNFKLKETTLSSAQSQSMIFVRAEKGFLKLFYYKKGSQLKDIENNKQLEISNISDSPETEWINLKSDFMNKIHKVSPKNPLLLSLNESDNNSDSVQNWNRSETMQPSESQWYNSWMVWGVVGGVLASGAVIYIMSNKENQVGSQGGIKVNLGL